MSNDTFDKSKLPSRYITSVHGCEGRRTMLYPMKTELYPDGLKDQDIDKPLVGVVSAWNEAAPCNIALQRQAQPAKKGVKDAGGTPREFCTITVTDGMAMGHQGMKSSLVSREVIADSIELTVRGHCYDALVGIAGRKFLVWNGVPRPHVNDSAACGGRVTALRNPLTLVCLPFRRLPGLLRVFMFLRFRVWYLGFCRQYLLGAQECTHVEGWCAFTTNQQQQQQQQHLHHHSYHHHCSSLV